MIIEIILHNIARRVLVAKIPGAHKGKLSGLCWADQNKILSRGVDQTIKMWDLHSTPETSSPGAGPSEVC
jgi:DDB1- and CUL4-associated factor 13